MPLDASNMDEKQLEEAALCVKCRKFIGVYGPFGAATCANCRYEHEIKVQEYANYECACGQVFRFGHLLYQHIAKERGEVCDMQGVVLTEPQENPKG